MSMSLQKLQLAFMDELSGQSNDTFRALVVENVVAGKMNRNRRIDVYRRNHIGARVLGLGNVYAVCRQILGAAAFDQLAEDYVATFKSSHWDLNFHGKDFELFLSVQCQALDELADLFYLPDLARLEWAFHISYYADANQSGAIHSQGTEQLRFEPDTSLHLLCSELPVYQIWRNNRDGRGDLAVVNDQSHYYQLIFRAEYVPQVHSLNEAQYKLLCDCIDGKSLTQLADIHGEAIVAHIPYFVEQRWLTLR